MAESKLDHVVGMIDDILTTKCAGEDTRTTTVWTTSLTVEMLSINREEDVKNWERDRRPRSSAAPTKTRLCMIDMSNTHLITFKLSLAAVKIKRSLPAAACRYLRTDSFGILIGTAASLDYNYSRIEAFVPGPRNTKRIKNITLNN